MRDQFLEACLYAQSLVDSGMDRMLAAQEAADAFLGPELEPVKCEFNSKGKSPVTWLGGKFRLSQRIIPLFPEHVCYVEPFAGAAWCLFRKTRSNIEVINDINGELVNFYRVLARFPEYFERKLEYALYSRQVFDELKHANFEALSDEERAWRFFYINRCSFGSHGCAGRVGSFGIQKTHNCNRATNRLIDANIGNTNFGTGRVGAGGKQNEFASIQASPGDSRLRIAHERLQRVIIEHKPYLEILKLYDCPTTFFYLDPPYYGCERDYGKGLFEREDFNRLAEILAAIKGKFLLSINDTPEIREVFKNFLIRDEFDVMYTAHHEHNIKKPELLIANYQD